MKNISISGGKAVIVVGNVTKKKKIFYFYGVGSKRIEFGTISAYTVEEATKILEANKTKGIYKVKEIDPDKEFQLLGSLTHSNAH